MRRILTALILVLLAAPAYAQQWDQVNGSMQVKSGPSAPLVIIDQTNTAANRKILSLRAAGTEKCSFDIDGDMTCAGSFTFVNLTFTGQAIGPLDTDCSAPAYSGLGKLTTGIAVRTAPSVATCVGGALIDLTTATAKTMQSTFTFATTNATITANRTSLATTSTDGVRNVNTTAATGGATVQISPRTLWQGSAWDTAASQTVAFFAETLPASAATPTGTLKFGYSLNGAAASYPLILTSDGAMTALDTIQGSQLRATATGWLVGATSIIAANGARSAVRDPGTDGLLNITDQTTAYGIQMNAGTSIPTFNNGTVTTGSKNQAGQVTLTGGNTGGVLTFSLAWTNAPFCTLTGSAATDIPQITGATTTSLTVAGFTANGVFTYTCWGRVG